MKNRIKALLATKERRVRKNRVRYFLCSLCSFVAILFSCSAADAADWVKAYRKGDYTNAFQALETMTNNFPDIGNYNRGNVLYRQKDFQSSEKAYSEAAALTKDDSLKQKALYNRGTALLAGTTTQTDPSKIDEKIAAATQAAGLFEQALTIQPDDLDAKQNLERAVAMQTNIRIYESKRLLQETDALIDQGKGKAAKTNCQTVNKILTPLLANNAPSRKEAQNLSGRANQIIQRLEHAVIQTQSDLEQAQTKIEEFKYEQAAEIAQATTLDRTLAFDLEAGLAQSFSDFQQKNLAVLKIFQSEAAKP